MHIIYIHTIQLERNIVLNMRYMIERWRCMIKIFRGGEGVVDGVGGVAVKDA